MKTRNKSLRAKEARAAKKKTKEIVSAAARSERLSVTKKIANEIIAKQRELGSSHYGCKSSIYKKYKEIYDWLDINNVNWHIYKLRKSSLECSQKKDDTNMNTDPPPSKQSNTSEPPQEETLQMVCDAIDKLSTPISPPYSSLSLLFLFNTGK